MEARFGHDTVWRGDAGYERRRRALVWNARVPPRYPAAIARPRGQRDVVAALRAARELGLTVAVRSGGHSWCATALRDGALVLDLSGLRELRLDASGRTATLGPGVTSAALSDALATHGLGFPAGHCRDVAVGGYLLAGGLGWNRGVWGPACHSVAAVDLVTADGRELEADDRAEPDLTWAARGAGPGFPAVVTAFHVELQPAPPSQATSSFAFPRSRLAHVAGWVAALARDLDPRLEVSLFLGAAPAALPGLGIAAGSPVVVVTAVASASSLDEAGELLAPLEEGVGRRGFLDSEARRETAQHALYEATGARLPAGRRYAVDCLYGGEELAATVEALGAALEAAPSASSWMLLDVSPARPPTVAPRPSAFAAGGRLYAALYAVWRDDDEAAAHLRWLHEAMAALAPLATRSYVGEADLTGRCDAAASCYDAESWHRLEAVRRRYDPEGLFAGFPNRGERQGRANEATK